MPGKRSDVVYFPDPSLENSLFGDEHGDSREGISDDDEEEDQVRQRMLSSWLEQCREEDSEDERWEEWGDDDDDNGDGDVGTDKEKGGGVPEQPWRGATGRGGSPGGGEVEAPVVDVGGSLECSEPNKGIWWSEKAGLSYAAPLPVVSPGVICLVKGKGSHAPPSVASSDQPTPCHYSATLLPPLPLSHFVSSRYSGAPTEEVVVCAEEDVCRMTLLALAGTSSQLFATAHQHTDGPTHIVQPPPEDPYAFDYSTRQPFYLTPVARRTRLIHLSNATLDRLLRWFLALANDAQRVRRGLEYLETVQMQGETEDVAPHATDDVFSATSGVTAASATSTRNGVFRPDHRHACVHSSSTSSLRVQSELLVSLRKSFKLFETATTQLEHLLVRQLSEGSDRTHQANDAASDTTLESQPSVDGEGGWNGGAGGPRVSLLQIYVRMRPWERLLSTLLTGLLEATCSVDCVSTVSPTAAFPPQPPHSIRDCLHHSSSCALLAQIQGDVDNIFLLMVHPSTLNAWKGDTLEKKPNLFHVYSSPTSGPDEDGDNWGKSSSEHIFFAQKKYRIMGYELYSSLANDVCECLQRVHLTDLMTYVSGTDRSGSTRLTRKGQFDWICASGKDAAALILLNVFILYLLTGDGAVLDANAMPEFIPSFLRGFCTHALTSATDVRILTTEHRRTSSHEKGADRPLRDIRSIR